MLHSRLLPLLLALLALLLRSAAALLALPRALPLHGLGALPLADVPVVLVVQRTAAAAAAAAAAARRLPQPQLRVQPQGLGVRRLRLLEAALRGERLDESQVRARARAKG